MAELSWGEAKLRAFVSYLAPEGLKVEYNVRPDWLRNPKTGYNLEYDIWIPSLRLALEYNGWQHFKAYHWSEGKPANQAQWERDRLKYELSRQAGVKLRTITSVDYKHMRLLRTKMLAWLSGGEYVPPSAPKRYHKIVAKDPYHLMAPHALTPYEAQVVFSHKPIGKENRRKRAQAAVAS